MVKERKNGAAIKKSEKRQTSQGGKGLASKETKEVNEQREN